MAAGTELKAISQLSEQISFKSTQIFIQLSPLLLKSNLNCWIYSAEIFKLPGVWKFD